MKQRKDLLNLILVLKIYTQQNLCNLDSGWGGISFVVTEENVKLDFINTELICFIFQSLHCRFISSHNNVRRNQLQPKLSSSILETTYIGTTTPLALSGTRKNKTQQKRIYDLSNSLTFKKKTYYSRALSEKRL